VIKINQYSFHQNLKSFFCGGWWESIISYIWPSLYMCRKICDRQKIKTKTKVLKRYQDIETYSWIILSNFSNNSMQFIFMDLATFFKISKLKLIEIERVSIVRGLLLNMEISAIESSKQCYRFLSYIFIYLVLIT
jgi:hypothetical protein